MEWVAAAAAMAASGLIGAAATDVWGKARDGVARIFRGAGGDGERLVRRLDEIDTIVRGADVEQQPRVREELLASWRTRLGDFLEEHPEAREELEAWAAEVKRSLPPASEQWVQTNTATGGGRVIAVQGGTQTYHEHGAGDAP